MAKSVGDKIGQAEYATLYTEVSNILGTPVNVTDDTTAYGWNVTPASSSVSVGDKVTAADWNNLRTDIVNTYDHIANSTTTSPVISTLSSGDAITATQYNNMETISTFNYANRFTAHSTHLTSSTGLTATQTATWNGTKTLSVTATWTSLAHKLQFWNAGGKLRFSFSGSNAGAGNKDQDWLGALNGFGTADLTATNFSTTGPASTVNTTRDAYYLFGNSDASTILTLITMNLSDINPAYSQYDENYLLVKAYHVSDTQMTFQFQVVDADAGDQTGIGPAVDEDITVDVTGTITVLTPNSLAVSVAAPSFSSGGWA
jgi:hypothetical protein